MVEILTGCNTADLKNLKKTIKKNLLMNRRIMKEINKISNELIE